MPAVREPSDGPEPLEIVEIRPGVRLKLNAADKAAILKHQADASERQRAWNVVNEAGEEPAAESAAAPDAEEAEVIAAPKPRARKK